MKKVDSCSRRNRHCDSPPCGESERASPCSAEARTGDCWLNRLPLRIHPWSFGGVWRPDLYKFKFPSIWCKWQYFFAGSHHVERFNSWFPGVSHKNETNPMNAERYIIYIYKYYLYIYIIYIYMYKYTSSTAQGGGGSFKNRKTIGELGCCESRMAERSHWWIERWLMSPLFLSLFLSFPD